MIELRVKDGEIKSLFLVNESIMLAPLFETIDCAIKYSRIIPGNKVINKKTRENPEEKQKKDKKEQKGAQSETSFCGSIVKFKITENHELCVAIDENEEMLFPLDYVEAVKILS